MGRRVGRHGRHGYHGRDGHHPPPGTGAPARVLAIGSAVALMITIVLAAGARLGQNDEMQVQVSEPTRPPLTAPDAPIAAEAGVFRVRPGDLAVASGAPRRPDAHPRTLAMHRAHRAYPGAPPAIPHGLTGNEMRDQACKTCHERGGFVPRFSAYAPVTPHPEMVSCLQCHAPDDALVGVRFPQESGDLCFQCHALDAEPAPFVELDWPEPRWPETRQRALPGSPPVIPHPLHFRENCLACHRGPSAVAEIRTTHPERANCRQCHVVSTTEVPPEAAVFTRPPEAGPARPGGAP